MFHWRVPFDEIVAPVPGGRVFETTVRPGLGDCAPSGRVRLDGIARLMQDVAFADIEDAGLERVAVWVLRRHRIRVLRFPRFGEGCARAGKPGVYARVADTLLREWIRSKAPAGVD